MQREYSAPFELFLLVTLCADKSGTLVTLQARSVVHFDEFFSQEPRVVLAGEGYGNGRPICDKDGTLGTFRAQSVVHFDESLDQRPRVIVAEVGCGNRHPVCVYRVEVLDA